MASLPPSSPRLPSPPPPAEIQLGPKPPSAGSTANRHVQQMEQTVLDANSKRRIHPGTRSADMAAGPPLVPLSELDSAFQLQEHLAALHYHHTATNTNPVTRETAAILATPPPGIDRSLWLYELCRFLIEQCNGLIVGFLFDTPPCSAATCPEMRASEWQFLCAVHDQPKSCCAIDYCCHTLDWAANVVTNPQIFPSRFVALSDAHDKGAAVKNLVNVFRRLHRIFAHAWFQHRGVFWTVEGQTGLYVLFKTVCDMYDLLPSENYKLPPEAEGLEAPRALTPSGGDSHPQQPQQQPPSQLGMTQPTSIARPRSQGAQSDGDGDHLNAANSRIGTRRHIRNSPSTGSAVTTVMESDEDDGGAGSMANRFRQMRIVEAAIPEDDPDAAEVPVIVEHITPVPPADGGATQTADSIGAATADSTDHQISAAAEADASDPADDVTVVSVDLEDSSETTEHAPVEKTAMPDDDREKQQESSAESSGSSAPDLAATNVTDFAQQTGAAPETGDQAVTEAIAPADKPEGTEAQGAEDPTDAKKSEAADDVKEPVEAPEAK
ncbi:hypothetical protein RB595_006533 [Gaeumannomyces hyphopodioides]